MHAHIASALAVVSSSLALGQVVNTEVEPNELKAAATLAASGGPGMSVGDGITGVSTGFAMTPGDSSRDRFLVRTAPMSAGLYRHRMAVSSVATGHIARIVGINADGTPSETVVTLTSQSVGGNSPAHTLQWYSFGPTPSQFYIEVLGSSSSTSQPYTVTYTEALAVNPAAIGPFAPGPITLTTDLVTRGGDTKLVVYDAQFDLVRQMDGVPGGNGAASTLVHTFAPGEYFVGVGIINLATNMPKEANDPAAVFALNEFPGIVTSSNPFGTPQDLSISITDANGSTVVPALRDEGFEIVWFRMTVGTTPTCGNSDFNGDGDFGTDADIEAFFACLGGNCCGTCWQGGSDFNGDGDFGTDQDIESFFRVLAGASC